MALGVSFLALLLAFGSMIFAWRAVDQAKDAKSFALSGRPSNGAASATPPVAGPETPAAPSETPSQLPSDLPSGIEDVPRSPDGAPVLTEQTVYEPKYEKQPLVLKATCGRTMYADLDEPRAKNEEAQADVRLVINCNADLPTFRLMDGVEGSEEARPGMTPKECAEKIRSAPIGRDAPIPVRKGTAVCITTSWQAARERGDRWRMILMHIVGVSNDGATTVEVSAWNIPD
ncbi:hypothetical protein O7628_10430 [Micromonospora sp. WMMD956]|uniref:hypothetical protein n=1 Tax=Micromonospora sp. WMMD956 TaxID=3016108 RepID=UPI002417E688|nr:hypothetical protein [Micromonospora sp. WMMD956]MDG4815921.1 hypothetical protein [Micromonospora sp. WMMD956]